VRRLNTRLNARVLTVLALAAAMMTSAALAARLDSASPVATPVPVFGLKPVAFLPAVSGSSHFMTLAPGSVLPSDAACAARVRQKPENKRLNAVYNVKTGHQRLGDDIFSGSDPRANTEIAVRVTGNFTGTTDMILQWAACKWGIDEDIVRAQAALESWWRQSAKGDWGKLVDRCPPGYGPGVDDPTDHPDECPESWGILQTRFPYERSAWPGMADSTAFNADTAYAIWRACFEGYEVWLNHVDRGWDYAPGDVWGCVGRWYAGRWHTSEAETYINRVKRYLDSRIWESPDFQE
jgi:hypothetical protein